MHGPRAGRWLAVLAAVGLLAAACGGGRQQSAGGASDGDATSPGITDTTVKLGSSTALSGPASAYGVIASANRAYFDHINEQGGVEMADGRTRQIEYVVYDDGYAPPRAVENVRRLIEGDQVFALMNTLGTPTNLAIWDYVNQQEVPHLLIASGSSHWGAHPDEHPWSMGLQPSYSTEGAVFAEYLKQERPDARVAILYQNDDYGLDYVLPFKEAIEGTGIQIVAEETYEVTDPTITSQMANLAQSQADVFFNVTTAKPAAQSITRMAELGWEPLHLLNGVSASIEAVLRPAGLEASTGLITTSWYKEPSDPRWADDPAMVQYKDISDRYGDYNPNDSLAFFGYISAMVMVDMLEQLEAPNREAMMDVARNLDLENELLAPGISIQTTPEDGYPIEDIQLRRFNGTQYEPVGEVISYEGRTPVPQA